MHPQPFDHRLQVQFGEGEWYRAPPWPQRWQGQVAHPWRSISPSPLIHRWLSHMLTLKSVACASGGGGSAAAGQWQWHWRRWRDGDGATAAARWRQWQQLSNSNGATAASEEPANGNSKDCPAATVGRQRWQRWRDGDGVTATVRRLRCNGDGAMERRWQRRQLAIMAQWRWRQLSNGDGTMAALAEPAQRQRRNGGSGGNCATAAAAATA